MYRRCSWWKLGRQKQADRFLDRAARPACFSGPEIHPGRFAGPGSLCPYGGPGPAMHTRTGGWAQQRIRDALLRPAWRGGMMRGARRCMGVQNAGARMAYPPARLAPTAHPRRTAGPGMACRMPCACQHGQCHALPGSAATKYVGSCASHQIACS